MNKAAHEDEIILSVKGVVNRFGSQVVHNGINMDITRGEIIGIAGGSGSGKSVLLKTMIGLHTPDAGKVTITGKPVASITPDESASLLGALFQEGALFSSLTVARNIMLPLDEHTDLPEDKQASLAQLKLALVGMPPESAAKYPSELSGGMTKRAALARALAMDPLILFLDEPTSGLDPLNAEGFDKMIVDLNHGLNVTVIMTTHDLDTLFTVCDRVAVLVDKKVIIDTMPNLLRSDNKQIKEFFQGPRARGAAYAAKHPSESTHGNQ